VRKIPGVGPVTERQLESLGFKTCADLADADAAKLRSALGKWGPDLQRRAQGRDDREVEPYGEPKQSSTEETFDKDTRDVEAMKEHLAVYAREVFEHLKASDRMGLTVVLKVKYHDFESITRSFTLKQPPEDWQEIFEVAARLLEGKTQAGKKPVRLLGLGISGLRPADEFKGSFTPDLFGWRGGAA
jgi:DNA polymerase-4